MWFCPPVCLIVRVLRHIKVCLARGTLASFTGMEVVVLLECLRNRRCVLEQIRY